MFSNMTGDFKGDTKQSIFLRFILACVALGVTSAMLFAPTVFLLGSSVSASNEIFDDLPAELDILPPSQQSVLLAADGTKIASFYAEDRIVVPISDISTHMQDAIVAIEDKRFYEHHGVDVEGIARALFRNLMGRPLEGASTLTQQYVKNSLVETALQRNDERAARKATEPTISRKITEAKYAIELEKKLSKKEILQGYLNIAPFGSKVYGVETASRYYFGHSAKDLNLAESTLLAGITQSPVLLDPVLYPENAKKKQVIVAGAMYDQGKISKEEYKYLRDIPIDMILNVQELPQGGCASAGSAAYFCSYVVHEIENSKVFGKTLAERRQLLLRGGLTIKTTLDTNMQADAQKAVEKAIPVNDPSGVKTSLISIQPGTGHILAMVQNTNWGNPTEEDPSATQLSFNADQQHGGSYGKQTGSTFKPFTLLEWYKNGHDAYEVVGGKYSYPASAWNIPCAPGNASNYTFHDATGRFGPVTVLRGTQQSLNSVYLAMAQKLNLCEIVDDAKKMGIKHGDGSDISVTPSAILGSNEVPPLYLANAYATFAARGKYCEPVVITEVKANNGKNIKLKNKSCKQVVEATNVDKVNATLERNIGSYGLSIGRPAAAKTGTTDNNTNLWFAGYTPNLATVVWAGHSEGEIPLINVNVNGRYYQYFWGETLGGLIWRGYMADATKELPVESFTPASIGKSKEEKDKEKEEEEERKRQEEEQNQENRQGDANVYVDPNGNRLPPPPEGYEYVFVE